MVMQSTEPITLALARTLIADGRARDIRRTHGLSLAEVAAGLGVSPAIVSAWERGERKPRRPNALAYAEILAELVALDLDSGEA